ncbi:MAG TPA: carboxymuconolactone decarboxylase family protein [Chloroflexota bacterium]|nr:carboxymuconolactone decarboxylase family protein [Chloroflexota bacterium]
MAGVPEAVRRFEEHDPNFLNDLAATAADAFAPGALEVKYKFLLAMALDAQANHPSGVKAFARRARDAGATEREIVEALRVVFYLGGMQALVTGAAALD